MKLRLLAWHAGSSPTLCSSLASVDRWRRRLAFAAALELPPATVKTTSSPFERCSTRAVAPGWRRKRNDRAVATALGFYIGESSSTNGSARACRRRNLT